MREYNNQIDPVLRLTVDDFELRVGSTDSTKWLSSDYETFRYYS